ncbi:MAG: PaaI family thioesterase [Deltaproteobacteria bacterium]|nr:PaaI family thioesterase [Deltaproteobacteria bacterium]MBW2394983.1 PaaI family thioesterase [Deltaproteobacteria bacterium]
METIRRWVEDSPYSRFLGVRLDYLSEQTARIVLPYQDENSNPGNVLHGGCAASLGAIGGQVLARAVLGEDSGPWHTAQMQVNYLAAAIGEDVVADAELLRRGKQLCFISVVVHTTEGKPIAQITTTVRGRMGAEPAQTVKSAGDQGEADPGPMGPHIGKVPFIGNRGIHVEHMTGGTSRLVMPFRDDNADLAGGVHEGAVLALLDTAGAMASWAESGPGRYKASTASMQLQNLAPAPKADLVAYGRCVQRDNEMFWSDVEVASAEDGQVTARGTVLYRILT